MSRLPNNSERELVDRLRRGDASAMGEVYACFANYLTAVCSRYIIEDGAAYFGPYPSVEVLEKYLELVK